MATYANFLNHMIPEAFNGQLDIKEFITDCNRFFEISKIEGDVQNVFVKGLLAKDLISIYEAVDPKITKFDERLKAAFEKPSSLIQDFMNLYNYEKGSDPAALFFQKIDTMVDKLLSHKWNKEELTSYFMVHCVKNVETKKELKMRDATKIEDIKSIVKKMEYVLEDNDVAVLNRKETFAQMVKKKRNFQNIPANNFSRNTSNQRKYYANSKLWNQKEEIKCFDCKKEGHSYRNCNQIRKIQCYACKEEGHIRRNCPNICCSTCKKQGHFSYQCFEKQQGQSGNFRFNNFRQRRNDNVAAINSEMRLVERGEYDDEIDDDYSKDRAPSSGEVIGAIH